MKRVQRTLVTVTLVGICKSVTVADCHSEDFQYKIVLFKTKKLDGTVTGVTVTEVFCKKAEPIDVRGTGLPAYSDSVGCWDGK